MNIERRRKPKGFEDEVPVDPMTGKKVPKEGKLAKLSSKRRLTRHEMDEIFMENDV